MISRSNRGKSRGEITLQVHRGRTDLWKDSVFRGAPWIDAAIATTFAPVTSRTPRVQPVTNKRARTRVLCRSPKGNLEIARVPRQRPMTRGQPRAARLAYRRHWWGLGGATAHKPNTITPGRGRACGVFCATGRADGPAKANVVPKCKGQARNTIPVLNSRPTRLR